MGSMRQWALGLALAAAPVMVGAEVVSAPDLDPEMRAKRAAFVAWQFSAVDVLLDHGSADALFTATMLLPQPSANGDTDTDAVAEAMQYTAAKRLALLDQAARLEPGADDIAFAALRICIGLDDCRVPEYAARLHRAAPVDGMWLLPALRDARKLGDAAEVTKLLAEMANANRMDSHYGAFVQRITRAFAVVPAPPIPPALLDQATEAFPEKMSAEDVLASTAIVSALVRAMPTYDDLAQSCKPEHAAFAARRDACRAIGMALGQGSSMIDNMIGLALRRMTADTEARRDLVKTERRHFAWLQHAFLGMGPEQQRNLLASVAKHGNETGAWKAMITEAGLPTTPPPGWISPREQRDLLQELERK